ncbi:receptor-type tyrosine-protein phosphatase kappa isoform X3 [Tachysurus ichikawai]
MAADVEKVRGCFSVDHLTFFSTGDKEQRGGCSFDDGPAQCDYQQDPYDDFDWTHVSAQEVPYLSPELPQGKGLTTRTNYVAILKHLSSHLLLQLAQTLITLKLAARALGEFSHERLCYALHLLEHSYGWKKEGERDVSSQRKWKTDIMWVIKERVEERKETERDSVRPLAYLAYRRSIVARF